LDIFETSGKTRGFELTADNEKGCPQYVPITVKILLIYDVERQTGLNELAR
jgi:hypothetical protein